MKTIDFTTRDNRIEKAVIVLQSASVKKAS